MVEMQDEQNAIEVKDKVRTLTYWYAAAVVAVIQGFVFAFMGLVALAVISMSLAPALLIIPAETIVVYDPKKMPLQHYRSKMMNRNGIISLTASPKAPTN